MSQSARIAILGLGVATLTPGGLHAQYRLTPSPVLDLSRLTLEPKFDGYIAVRESGVADSITFSVQRARLTVQARPVPNAALRIQADFAAVGTTTADTVPAIALTDAYAQLGFAERRGLRGLLDPALIVGQFKAPFSLEFLSPYSSLLTVNRSRAVSQLSVAREIGVLGHVALGRHGAADVALLNGSGQNRPSNADKKQMAVGRLTIIPARNLAVAGKWMNQGGDHRWGYDARWLVGRAVLEGEAIKQESGGPTSGVDAGGGYALVAYRILPWLQPLFKWERLRYAQRSATSRSESRLHWTTYGVNVVSPDDRERLRLQLNWVRKSERPVAVRDEVVAQLILIF